MMNPPIMTSARGSDIARVEILRDAGNSAAPGRRPPNQGHASGLVTSLDDGRVSCREAEWRSDTTPTGFGGSRIDDASESEAVVVGFHQHASWSRKGR